MCCGRSSTATRPRHPPVTRLQPPPEEVTRLLEKERVGAQNLVRRGHLRVVDEDTPREAPVIDLPDPTDPRPVARITCTIGALADLVDVLEYQQIPPVSDVAQTTAHILAAAALVARHALAHGALDAGAWPLAVGQHTEGPWPRCNRSLRRGPPGRSPGCRRSRRSTPATAMRWGGPCTRGRAPPMRNCAPESPPPTPCTPWPTRAPTSWPRSTPCLPRSSRKGRQGTPVTP